MESMEERWRRRQSETRGDPGSAAQSSGMDFRVWDAGQLTEEQKLEAWRQLHATHLHRQSKAIESIRTYVAIWFWLTIAGAALFVVATAAAAIQF